jgi:hypothetical protein
MITMVVLASLVLIYRPCEHLQLYVHSFHLNTINLFTETKDLSLVRYERETCREGRLGHPYVYSEKAEVKWAY